MVRSLATSKVRVLVLVIGLLLIAIAILSFPLFGSPGFFAYSAYAFGATGFLGLLLALLAWLLLGPPIGRFRVLNRTSTRKLSKVKVQVNQVEPVIEEPIQPPVPPNEDRVWDPQADDRPVASIRVDVTIRDIRDPAFEVIKWVEIQGIPAPHGIEEASLYVLEGDGVLLIVRYMTASGDMDTLDGLA